MITSTSTGENYVIELSDGTHLSYADVPAESGGRDKFQRPGDILTSSFAACMNMTIQRILQERGLNYEIISTETRCRSLTTRRNSQRNIKLGRNLSKTVLKFITA